MSFIVETQEHTLRGRKYGNVVTIRLVCSVKSLSGYDVIVPVDSIPTGVRPNDVQTFCISARNEGSWASAIFEPSSIQIRSDGSIYLATGTGREDVSYINGAFTYLVF